MERTDFRNGRRVAGAVDYAEIFRNIPEKRLKNDDDNLSVFETAGLARSRKEGKKSQ